MSAEMRTDRTDSRREDPSSISRVVSALAAARKYRDVAPEALERVARDSIRRARGVDDAIKRAKRKLHQICAAFVPASDLERAERRLATLLGGERASAPPLDLSDESTRAACRGLLALHASTRERLDVLETFYGEIFDATGIPRRLLDLGCGLHPFALPWMGLPRASEYEACDLHRRALALIERWFARVGQRGSAHVTDLVAPAPRTTRPSNADARFDVALLLKLLPTLERQEEGAAARLLDRVDARFFVVSFPTASLGRREKGMAASYARFAREQLEPRGRIVREVEIGSELVYVVARGKVSGSDARRR